MAGDCQSESKRRCRAVKRSCRAYAAQVLPNAAHETFRTVQENQLFRCSPHALSTPGNAPHVLRIPPRCRRPHDDQVDAGRLRVSQDRRRWFVRPLYDGDCPTAAVGARETILESACGRFIERAPVTDDSAQEGILRYASAASEGGLKSVGSKMRANTCPGWCRAHSMPTVEHYT